MASHILKKLLRRSENHHLVKDTQGDVVLHLSRVLMEFPKDGEMSRVLLAPAFQRVEVVKVSQPKGAVLVRLSHSRVDDVYKPAAVAAYLITYFISERAI